MHGGSKAEISPHSYYVYIDSQPDVLQAIGVPRQKKLVKATTTRANAVVIINRLSLT
jgi:hypothetical protein